MVLEDQVMAQEVPVLEAQDLVCQLNLNQYNTCLLNEQGLTVIEKSH